MEGPNDVFRDLALVEGIAAVPGKRSQGRGERRIAHDLAGVRRPSVVEIVKGPAFIVLEKLRFELPVPRHPRQHRHALLRERDRRLEGGAERHGSMRLEEAIPGVDGARHRHADGSAFRHVRHPGPREPGRVGRGGSPPRAVDPDDRPVGLANEGEAVAADARHGRLRDAQDCGRRDRRIDGVAAPLHRVERRECRLRRGGRRHRLGRVDRRTSRSLEIAHLRYPLSKALDGKECPASVKPRGLEACFIPIFGYSSCRKY